MYTALLVRRLARLRQSLWQSAVTHSGLLIVITAAVLLLIVGAALKERGRGHLAKLKTELKGNTAVPQQPVVVKPGGQEAIVLERSQIIDTGMPEFLSTTLLPGRGMNVLQIRAHLPHRGEVNLLASPSLDEAAKLLNGTGEDADGGASLSMGGAIEVPWAGRIWGTSTTGGTNLTTTWQGHTLSLPATWRQANDSSRAASMGGLLLTRNADTVRTTVMPDGGQTQTICQAGNFNGHWVSHTEVTTTVQLSSRALEMTVSAHNTGQQAEPVGIGWHPRFAVTSGDRGQVTLKLPNALHAEVADRRTGMPSGRLLPVEGTPYDFTRQDGAPLNALSLDDSFVHLKPGLLDNGPTIEMRDPKSNYGLRISVMSSAIKAIRVYAPANKSFVSIDPQFNYDDPFGREWPKGEDTGMVVLQPGQTAQWKIRLEIFSLANAAPL
jgi:galactose mutarotase-like enzyme